MADLITYGQDEASGFLYRITLTPYEVISVIPDHDFLIDNLYIDRTHYSTYTIHDYDMQLSGGITEAHRESFTRTLEGHGVPTAACNDTVSFVYDHLCRFDSSFSNAKNISALLMIEVTRYDYYEDEDWAMEVSVGDSLRPTPACRGAVEALEKVWIRAGDEMMSCAVCLEEFSVGCEATKMPCSHVFHGDCIRRWLENRVACPLCRFELPSWDEN